MARPKTPIDEEQLLKLAMIQCSRKEIASFFNVSTDTIDRRYAHILAKGYEMGRMSLRRSMFRKVDEGNIVMMIWLSKQYLGFSDKTEQTSTVVLDTIKEFESLSKEEQLRRLDLARERLLPAIEVKSE